MSNNLAFSYKLIFKNSTFLLIFFFFLINLNSALASTCKIVKVDKKTLIVEEQCSSSNGWVKYRKYFVINNEKKEIEAGAISPAPSKKRYPFSETKRESKTGKVIMTILHSQNKFLFYKKTKFLTKQLKKKKLYSQKKIFVCHKKGDSQVECSDGKIYFEDKPAECLNDVFNSHRNDKTIELLPTKIILKEKVSLPSQ